MQIEHTRSELRSADQRTPIVAALAGVVLVWVCSSCALEAERATPAPGGTISGTITYDGPAAWGGRLLAIAVYPTAPPKGPPIAWRLVEQYSFPYAYVFEGLPPGSYLVGALIDVDPADTRYGGMLNSSRDPHGWALDGALVAVDAAVGAAAVDVRVEDVP